MKLQTLTFDNNLKKPEQQTHREREGEGGRGREREGERERERERRERERGREREVSNHSIIVPYTSWQNLDNSLMTCYNNTFLSVQGNHHYCTSTHTMISTDYSTALLH